MASEKDLAALQVGQPSAAAKAHPAQKAALAAAAAGATWRVINFPTVADAVNFANVPPAQQGGEFGMTVDPAGGVAGYYFF